MILWQILATATFASMGLVFVIYIGYYLYILRLLKNKSKQQVNIDFRPKITIIVPTYNDAETIEDKLLNLIEQSYPTDMIDVLLIDSNSKDETVNKVRKFMVSYPEISMKIIVENERKGKSEAINKALSTVDPQSEIVVMTDANAFLNRDALERIVSCFSCPQVGAVVGRQIIPSTDNSNEALSETAYLSFYQKMREGESIIDSTPIFDGEFSAYRTRVIRDKKIREDLNADDSQLATIVRREGYKAVIEPEALFYEALPTNRQSLRIQKVRRGQGLARLFWYNKDIMFKTSYGKFGSVILPINFFMHIISPFLVFSTIILAIMSILFYVFQTGQLVLPAIFLFLVLTMGLIDRILPTKTKTLSIGLTFVRYQLILLEGIIQLLRGKSLHKWEKVEKTYVKQGL